MPFLPVTPPPSPQYIVDGDFQVCFFFCLRAGQLLVVCVCVRVCVYVFFFCSCLEAAKRDLLRFFFFLRVLLCLDAPASYFLVDVFSSRGHRGEDTGKNAVPWYGTVCR